MSARGEVLFTLCGRRPHGLDTNNTAFGDSQVGGALGDELFAFCGEDGEDVCSGLCEALATS